MGVYNEYENDYLFNNELDSLEYTMKMKENGNSFIEVSSCIQRLYHIFDSIYPNIYRIHCSDSLRILNEIICLTKEYLHVSPSSMISTNELLLNENYFENFISQLRRPSLIPRRPYPTIKTQLHYFGQGIDEYNYNNQLNQTLVFCFEITNQLPLPIDVIILDPDDNLVLSDTKYINTYNKGLTKLYSCSYTPITKTGIYTISFFYNNIKLPNSKQNVFIRNSISNNYSPEVEKSEQGKY